MNDLDETFIELKKLKENVLSLCRNFEQKTKFSVGLIDVETISANAMSYPNRQIVSDIRIEVSDGSLTLKL